MKRACNDMEVSIFGINHHITQYHKHLSQRVGIGTDGSECGAGALKWPTLTMIIIMHVRRVSSRLSLDSAHGDE